MCGIAGLWTASAASAASTPADVADIAARMSARLIHRGPDDDGVWSDPPAGIALAHRRLAVLDLSPEGHQPMRSRDRRYVIVFNGEIYNHAELRRSLGDVEWRGHSDTEVLLEAILRWGLEAALQRCVGMFALALWDGKQRSLALARDRLGEKPLYYGWLDGALVFASELKALRAHPGWRGEIDRPALGLYLRYGVVPTPQSIYRGIRKLAPGVILSFSSPGSAGTPQPYWRALEAARQGRESPLRMDDNAAAAALEALLRESVACQSCADVPLGAFLSGGVDSSLIVALMQTQGGKPVKTFTIGFAAPGYDEAPYAAAVARHLGTEHTELYVTPEEARRIIPRLPELYDEPFADSSQIPAFLVAALARRQVTVVLSGDGGDELFGGYTRYRWGPRILRLGSLLRQPLAALLGTLSPAAWDAVFQRIPLARRADASGDKLYKLAALLRCDTNQALYQQFLSFWPAAEALVIGDGENNSWPQNSWPDDWSFAEQMMLGDAQGYLPDDILTKVDRASMAVSLETRAPYLDHRVFEFAWRLPLPLKIRNRQSKWLLRQVLYKYVPREMIERPKAGFSVPIGEWLLGPLHEWAEALLDEGRLRREAYFEPGPIRTIRKAWHEHQQGVRNWQHRLWAVLMFQAWLENNVL
ncbi:MAG: asparagine synthase (glutamine-hydrolyzing) [Sterolibacterium sp.]